jgi:hypothetical protein
MEKKIHFVSVPSLLQYRPGNRGAILRTVIFHARMLCKNVVNYPWIALQIIYLPRRGFFSGIEKVHSGVTEATA